MKISTTALHLPDNGNHFSLTVTRHKPRYAVRWDRQVTLAAHSTRQKQRTQYTKKKALVCVWGCERFKDILADRPFVLRTDNQALATILKLGNKNSHSEW